MRVLVLGDSLGLPRPHRINDYSPNEKELAVRYDQTYSSLIQRELLDTFKDTLYCEVINRSKRFCTLKDIATEFIDYLFYYEPDVIILQIGIVDCWFRENGKQLVGSEEFESYFKYLLKLLSYRENCKLIIVGISPTSLKMNARYAGLNGEIRKYNNIYKKYINNKNIFYIDMEAHVKTTNIHKYILPDDHHLNPIGNLLVSNEVLTILKSLIFNKLGFEMFENQNLIDALNNFKLGYSIYPYNLDNIYNLLLMLYENKEFDMFQEVASFCRENINDHDINELLSIF